MVDQLGRRSASEAIGVFRRYVTDFVNRHDFSAIAEFMADDYTLDTSGVKVAGRDGDYRAAVARQLQQFPGLVFTPHEIVHVGDRIGIRFTEHGGAAKDGAVAAWPSIAIYRLKQGRLASCAIEQDYYSRHQQLAHGLRVQIDAPASAPWDTGESVPDPHIEAVVVDWLHSGAFIADAAVQLDDSRATGIRSTIVDDPRLEILELLSGGGKVAFHAIQTGRLAGDFARDVSPEIGQPVVIYISGLVTVSDGAVVSGNVIRDRWGLYRRLARPAG